MPSVYIETSIVSYLRSDPAKQVISAAKQVATKQWWVDERPRYDVFVSQLVLDEASRGNAELVRERLEHIAGIPILAVTREVLDVAAKIMSENLLPTNAQAARSISRRLRFITQTTS